MMVEPLFAACKGMILLSSYFNCVANQIVNKINYCIDDFCDIKKFGGCVLVSCLLALILGAAKSNVVIDSFLR